MEAYLASTKPGHDPAHASRRAASLKPGDSSTSRPRATSVNPAQGKQRLYETLSEAPKASAALTGKNLVQGGLRERNRPIFKTLGKEDNPITNSTAYSRTMHIQSCATGHQSGGGGQRWTLHRNAKLRMQAADAESQALKGVIAHINGYTGRDMTNTQLKELVERQGGSFVTMCSARVTHIFVTENLSAKKAQHYLEARRKNGTKLVTPEWAIACAEKGKRVSEAKFAAPVFNEMQQSTYKMFAQEKGETVTTSTETTNACAGPSPLSSARRTSPRATSSSSSESRVTPEPTAALLPSAQISPRRSPRNHASSVSATVSASTSAPTSATALLLEQIKTAKAQRSPSHSPNSKDAERKRGWCATWECVVESPGRKRKRLAAAATSAAAEVSKIKDEKENKTAPNAKQRGRRTTSSKSPKKEEVLVLGSSDTEEDAQPKVVHKTRPLQPSLSWASLSEDDPRRPDLTADEDDEWSLPPSAQPR